MRPQQTASQLGDLKERPRCAALEDDLADDGLLTGLVSRQVSLLPAHDCEAQPPSLHLGPS
eukprot:5030343-Amphidinium_carterae.1